MEFDIDVSGEDILNKDYTICIADKDGKIAGFKFSDEIVFALSSRYKQGDYRYKKSKSGRSLFKIRLYCIVIYYLFKSLKLEKEISLKICKDFDGREQDIKENLKHFLGYLLKLNISQYYFGKLDDNSNAHNYAYLMRRDSRNKMKTYTDIKLKDFEIFLKK